MKEKLLNFCKKTNILFIISLVFLMALKGWLYFLVQKVPTTIHHIQMAIDGWIPFVKYFYVFYVSYYFLPVILLYILSFYDRKKFWKLFSTAVAANIIAFGFFIFFQVQMIRPEGYENYTSMADVINGFKGSKNISEFFDSCIRMQYYLDAGALNCFPSLHCSLATVEALIGIHLFKDSVEHRIPLWMRIVAVTFGVGTIISTVFVKQHYFVDLVAGVAITLGAYCLIHCLLVRLESKGKMKWFFDKEERATYIPRKERKKTEKPE